MKNMIDYICVEAEIQQKNDKVSFHSYLKLCSSRLFAAENRK